MTPPQYPLCEALGVQLRTMSGEFLNVPEAKGLTEVVLAADLERIIKAAPVVYGALPGTGNWGVKRDAKDDTHTARLLCVQPIVCDTAESLLAELVALRTDHGQCAYSRNSCDDIVARARKLLGAK